jgi:hypothetical protein
LRKIEKKLAPIADSVIFCGHLGLPPRGHHDGKYHPEVGSYSTGEWVKF